jgi:hypothetical protein
MLRVCVCEGREGGRKRRRIEGERKGERNQIVSAKLVV